MIILLIHNKNFIRYTCGETISLLRFLEMKDLKHIEEAQWPTPTQDDNGLFVNLDVSNSDQKIHNIIERLVRRTKKFLQRLKYKECPAQRNIYQKVNPSLDVVICP